MKLTENQRIFFNIVVSYGRALLILFCGLLSGRWVLSALGEVHFGLLGLVGSLLTFVSFLDSTIALSVSRFYAVSVGISKRNPEKGLVRCRKFFTTALSLHVTMAVLLTAIGYPVGKYVVMNILTIPPDAVDACVVVWQCSCITCFVSMATVPYRSFFTAKQLIAEVTVYKIATMLLMTAFAYYMTVRPNAWLVPYAVFTCVVTVGQKLLITLRAQLHFSECRVVGGYIFNKLYMKTLFAFSFWKSFSLFSSIVKRQGLAILINQYFGVAANSASSLSSKVTAQVASLSNSLLSAFTPAITNAYGAGEYAKMHSLSFLACKCSVLLFLIFMTPLFWELPYVMELWLQKVPQYTVGLCRCVLIKWMLDKITIGHRLAVSANGKIALYNTLMAPVVVLALPVAWIMVEITDNFYCIGYAMIIGAVFQSLGRIILAKYLVNMSVQRWIFRIFLPVLLTGVLSSAAACLPQFFMEPSFLRLLATGGLTGVVLLPSIWFIALDRSEKEFVVIRLEERFQKIKRRLLGRQP